MPIEIRELHIKVNVTSPTAEQPASAAERSVQSSGKNSNDTDEMVASCIEKVMEIFKNKTER